jgi:spore coat polysaccharide biosynthesis protein SpsF
VFRKLIFCTPKIGFKVSILAITQARYGSSRLPGKILKKVKGMSLLEIHLKRIQGSQLIDEIKVATTNESESIEIEKIAKALDVQTFHGSIDNVLERFYLTALPESPQWVVRLTSDCPLVDPEIIDKVIQYALDQDLDYVSNTLSPTFPDGLDVEIFKFSALKKAYEEAELRSELEHVTPYIWKNSTFMGRTLFSSDVVKNTVDLSGVRITVDTSEDFEVIKELIEREGIDSPWMRYVDILEEQPHLSIINQQYSRNEGYDKSINGDNEDG